MTPTFQGEVQFRRWSDSSTQGVQITFALPDSEDLEPLKAKAGKRFMAVLVEIGDDEQPVQPVPRKDKRGPLCREACDYCEMVEFRDWMQAEYGSIAGGADGAKLWLCSMLGISSRKELDSDRNAGGEFLRLVRIPFMRYMKTRQAA
jgi:hypothetical protein